MNQDLFYIVFGSHYDDRTVVYVTHDEEKAFENCDEDNGEIRIFDKDGSDEIVLYKVVIDSLGNIIEKESDKVWGCIDNYPFWRYIDRRKKIASIAGISAQNYEQAEKYAYRYLERIKAIYQGSSVINFGDMESNNGN